MDAQTRKDLTPQGYIHRMFAETENGILRIGYENPDNGFIEEERIFHLNWTSEDADTIVSFLQVRLLQQEKIMHFMLICT